MIITHISKLINVLAFFNLLISIRKSSIWNFFCAEKEFFVIFHESLLRKEADVLSDTSFGDICWQMASSIVQTESFIKTRFAMICLRNQFTCHHFYFMMAYSNNYTIVIIISCDDECWPWTSRWTTTSLCRRKTRYYSSTIEPHIYDFLYHDTPFSTGAYC